MRSTLILKADPGQRLIIAPLTGPSVSRSLMELLVCAGRSHDLYGLCVLGSHHVHWLWPDLCRPEAAEYQERCQELAEVTAMLI